MTGPKIYTLTKPQIINLLYSEKSGGMGVGARKGKL